MSVPKPTQPNEVHQNKPVLSLIQAMAPEIRNLVYEAYFPGLPPAKTPLLRAHEYSPSTGLCFVDKGVCSETLAYLAPIRDAWKSCTWTVDLDHFFPPIVPGAQTALCGAVRPADITARLADADAGRVRTLEFSTSAFALPAREGVDVLTAPFTFTITRLSTHRVIISSPLIEAQWRTDGDLLVDADICVLLSALHEALADKAAEDRLRARAAGRGSGRHAWDAQELRGLLEVVQKVMRAVLVRRTVDPAWTAKEVPWAAVWAWLDANGVWDGERRETNGELGYAATWL